MELGQRGRSEGADLSFSPPVTTLDSFSAGLGACEKSTWLYQ